MTKTKRPTNKFERRIVAEKKRQKKYFERKRIQTETEDVHAGDRDSVERETD